MNGKQVLKCLRQHGWEHYGTKGSHHKLRKTGFPPIVVPVHGNKDLKKGTLKSIEKIVGFKLQRG